MKKFALVYFLTDHTYEVVRRTDIQDFDEEEWKANKRLEWVVIWRPDKETSEECPGLVKGISDDKRSLVEKRETFIKMTVGGDASTPVLGRGQKRRPNRSLAMSQESSSQETSKKTHKDGTDRRSTAAQAVGSQQARALVSSPQRGQEGVRQRRLEDTTSLSADENYQLQQQVKELKGQVQRLEDVTTRMEHLETITKRLEALLQSPSSSNASSTVERQTVPLTDLYTDKIPKALVHKCNKSTPQKFVNDLMDGMYSKQYLAQHTARVPGRNDDKKRPLKKEELMSIIGFVQFFFPYACETAATACIRQKLNNSGKKKKSTPGNQESRHRDDNSVRDDESVRDDNSDSDNEDLY